MATIKALIYAQTDYTTGETKYGIYTISKVDKKKISFFKHSIESGLWDGVVGSGIEWADDMYNSLKELVVEIQRGAKEFNKTEISITFDFPDHVQISFFQPEWLAVDNCLYRERPLNEHERNQFVVELASLQSIASSDKTDEK